MVQSFIHARTLGPLGTIILVISCRVLFSMMVFLSCNYILASSSNMLPRLTSCCPYFLTDMRKPDLAAKIAKQLRKFHQVEVPGSKEPQLWNDIFKFFKQGPYFTLSCIRLLKLIFFTCQRTEFQFILNHIYYVI